MEQPFCYYSFELLDPQNPDSTLRIFVSCTNCHKNYHEKYWNELKRCLYCQGEHAQRLNKISVPAKAQPEIKIPLLPKPPQTIWFGPWYQNPRYQLLIWCVCTFVASACFILLARLQIWEYHKRQEAAIVSATQSVLANQRGQTETARPTNTPTFTFTPSLPPSITPTTTNTLYSSDTPTIEPSDTPPARKTCPGAPPIRVEIGDTARVSYNNGKPLYLRSAPVVGQNVQWYLYGGTAIKIIAGPDCSNDVSFFEVSDLSNGHTGWVPEADADSTNYLLDLVP